MYNVSDCPIGLGQLKPGDPGFVGPVKPSRMDNVFAALEKGLATGLTVADKIKQLQDLTKARKQAQEQARLASQIPTTMFTPTRVLDMDWMTIGLMGVGGIALFALLAQKKGA